MEESGIDYKKYFSSYIDYEKLPWEIQDCIISKEYLKNEYLNALAFKPTSECSADCKNCKDRCLGGYDLIVTFLMDDVYEKVAKKFAARKGFKYLRIKHEEEMSEIEEDFVFVLSPEK